MAKKRKLFGTDGIRGKTGEYPLSPHDLTKVAMAAGSIFQRGDYRHRVVIGKDTRLSGYMIETALVSGFTAVGMDVFLLGPMPTPAVSMLTRSMRADLGVMISASHNLFHDNGLKFFQNDGLKLSDEIENKIAEKMDEVIKLAKPDRIGRASRIENASARYIEFVKSSVPRDLNLEGLRIVIDCANGAAYSLAPTLLWELGAEVKSIGISPNGFNINSQCGSTYPENMRNAVIEYRADIGIALDGDADRLIICTEKGDIIDGDQILALIACYWKKENILKNDMMVCSIMSNGGLDAFLSTKGINTKRSPIGDRYVAKFMRDHGCVLGGENSGHVIMSNYSSTGDGLMVALKILELMVKNKCKLSKFFPLFEPYPQKLRNIPTTSKDKANHEKVKEYIENNKDRLGNYGRILVRPSGTEPIIRVMVEGEDKKIVASITEEISTIIENL